jgi:hypothetical protein
MANKSKPVIVSEVVDEPIEISLVAPIESVEDVSGKDTCWNCDGYLNSDGICKDCGFNKGLLYNLDIEAADAIRRQKAKVI